MKKKILATLMSLALVASMGVANAFAATAGSVAVGLSYAGANMTNKDASAFVPGGDIVVTATKAITWEVSVDGAKAKDYDKAEKLTLKNVDAGTYEIKGFSGKDEVVTADFVVTQRELKNKNFYTENNDAEYNASIYGVDVDDFAAYVIIDGDDYLIDPSEYTIECTENTDVTVDAVLKTANLNYGAFNPQAEMNVVLKALANDNNAVITFELEDDSNFVWADATVTAYVTSYDVYSNKLDILEANYDALVAAIEGTVFMDYEEYKDQLDSDGFAEGTRYSYLDNKDSVASYAAMLEDLGDVLEPVFDHEDGFIVSNKEVNDLAVFCDEALKYWDTYVVNFGTGEVDPDVDVDVDDEDDDTDEEKGESATPETGDATPVALFASMLALSALAGASLLVKKATSK